jgi:bacillopeptidase F
LFYKEDKMRGIKAIILMLLFGAGLLVAGYITPSLQAVLDTLSPGNKTWVSVHLREKPDLARFPQKAYAEKIAYLKEFAQRTQRPLLDFANSFGNQIDSLQLFWIYNGFCLKATKPAILALASRSDVDFVNGGEAGKIESPSGYGAPPPPAREWNIERVGAHLVWLDGYTGNGIVVCIFDSGMRLDHESYGITTNWKWRDEYGWEYAWFDATEPNPSPTPFDYSGHGTHVGGIAIGGDGYAGNLRDIGVAPGAKLIACTWGRYQYTERFHECFQWIVDLTNTPYGNLAPDVVNCSWGFDPNNLEYWDDVNLLRDLGIIVVFCAGNNWGGPYVWAPGNYPITIGVGATDYADIKASFSCVGHAPDANPWNIRDYWSRPDWDTMGVDLMAPGTKNEAQGIGIYSADKDDPHGYIHMLGTSQATPHVTGAIALMLEASQDYFGYKIDYYDIYNILIDAANRDIGGPFPNVSYGWGRLDCKSAVDSVLTFHLKSSSPAALANNNQKKIVYDLNQQKIHLVYQSCKYIRYTYSTDFGTSWSLEEKVGDGEAPCLALDGDGNPHCIFKSGARIRYNRRVGGQWESGYTIFEDSHIYELREAPSFVISGILGHVAFQAYGDWLGEEIRYGYFDITSSWPLLQWITLDNVSGTGFPFGAPAIAVQNNDIHVVYAYPPIGPMESYESYEIILRSSFNGWEPILVSTPDYYSSINPHIAATSEKLWIFWEDGGIDNDIYYRVRTSQGWLNDPTPVYTNTTPSVSPRAIYNVEEPDKIYCVWSEFDNNNNQWDIFCSAYYDSWQLPVNISNTANIDSRNPDLAFVPSGIIEGKLVISYAEGNEYWSEGGKFLPLYRVCTYQSVLPLAPGGGPQSYSDEKLNSRNLLILQPNPFRNSVKIGVRAGKYGKYHLEIYNVLGQKIKTIFNEERQSGYYELTWDGKDDRNRQMPAGVYYVLYQMGDSKTTAKIVLLK